MRSYINMPDCCPAAETCDIASVPKNKEFSTNTPGPFYYTNTLHARARTAATCKTVPAPHLMGEAGPRTTQANLLIVNCEPGLAIWGAGDARRKQAPTP